MDVIMAGKRTTPKSHFRSSRLHMFFRIGVSKNVAMSHGNTSVGVSF